MKKLAIYTEDFNGKKVLLRTVRVNRTFIGIGANGQTNHEEFKKLAQDLEPTSTSFQLLNL